MIHLVSFSSSKHIKGIDFHEIVQESAEWAKFTSCENDLGVSVWWTLWRGWCFLRRPQVSAVGMIVCSKFLGLQTFGSFKGFKWMGRVQNFKLFYQTFSEGERRSFFRNFMIRIIIKCSKNISCVSSFLFHTNVVKHEKEGQ